MSRRSAKSILTLTFIAPALVSLFVSVGVHTLIEVVLTIGDQSCNIVRDPADQYSIRRTPNLPQRLKPVQPSLDWQVQSARLTTFFVGGETPDPAEFWSSVVGNDPIEEHKRSDIGQFQQVGTIGEWGLQLLAQPGRLDWSIALQSPVEGASDVISVLLGGPFDSALSAIRQISTKWLEICPATNRIAFGTILIRPVEDRRSGYTGLSDYLHSVKIDKDNSIDLNYQINRPRDSKTLHDLKMNRLNKWSVVRAGILRVSVTGGRTNLSQSDLHDERHGMRLELDISTSEERREELPKSKLVAISNELIGEGLEIAQKGDIT